MQNPSLQLTIRGVDAHTKQQLTKMAARTGVSLNAVTLDILKQAAGTTGTAERLQHIKQTLRQHRISSADIAAAEEAVAAMDVISKAKQQRDEHDLNL